MADLIKKFHTVSTTGKTALSVGMQHENSTIGKGHFISHLEIHIHPFSVMTLSLSGLSQETLDKTPVHIPTAHTDYVNNKD